MCFLHSKKDSWLLSIENKLMHIKYYKKHANGHHFFLRAIINICIQVIFPNIITYLDRTFKVEQNDINLEMK